MTILASIAVVVAAMLAPDRLQSRINAIQVTLSKRADPPPKYLRYDNRTIIAAYRWQDAEGPNGLVVAYRLGSDGSLKRLSTFKYGDNPTAIALVEATGDDKPEIAVTGTNDQLEILEWDGRYLSELAETTPSARFIDIDGDGVPEVVSRADDGTVYVDRIAHGRLDAVPTPGLEDVIEITKTTSDAETFEQTIVDPPTTLRAVASRGTSVILTDESDRVIPPGEPLTDSRIRVNVTGPKGARVAILVYAPQT
ncbi:MAG TPA: hypothetical protein VLU46_02550, partial [Thermoanaerobaculia bacterium]|nr:hypothetical protein [Thermoanaerobaculia bacterium]